MKKLALGFVLGSSTVLVMGYFVILHDVREQDRRHNELMASR